MLNNLGMFAYYDGRWADAVRLYRDGADASTKAGNIGSAAFGDCNLGEVRSDQGRSDEAREHLERALEIWRATGYAWGVAFATTLLGRLEARAGHGALAEAHLRDALGRFRQLRVSPDALWVEALLPEACVFDGRPHDALDDLERLIGVAGTGRLAPLLFRARGVACAQIGQLDEARAALDAAVAPPAGAATSSSCSSASTCSARSMPHDADRARERDAIAARLDIAAAPPVPIRAAASRGISELVARRRVARIRRQPVRHDAVAERVGAGRDLTGRADERGLPEDRERERDAGRQHPAVVGVAVAVDVAERRRPAADQRQPEVESVRRDEAGLQRARAAPGRDEQRLGDRRAHGLLAVGPVDDLAVGGHAGSSSPQVKFGPTL